MRDILEYSRSRLSSVNLWTLAFLVMLLIHILPIWVFKYFPAQDGPSHVYNSFILRHYNDPEYRFNEFYDVRICPVPNWMSHASMMLLMYLVPPLIAEKIFLTGYVILMAMGMLYLLNVVEKGRTPLVFIGFPFIYNFSLLVGLYNSSLSMAMLMPVIGYWWKHFKTFGARNMIILALLLVVMYFCHLISLVPALFSIATLAFLGLLPKFTRWKQTSLSLLSMLPAIGLIFYYIRMAGATRGDVGELGRLWKYFVRNESLAYYSQSQVIIGKFVTGAFVILFLYALIRDHFLTREWRFGLRLHKKDLFLLLCVAFFAMYLRAPSRMSSGSIIKERLSLLPFLIIIPWLSWDMPRIAKGIVSCALILLSVVYLTHASYHHKRLSDYVEVYTSGYDVMERNKVLMPLIFERSDHSGKTWRLAVFSHSGGHYGHATGCIDLSNYETNGFIFPTSFKPDLHRPPYHTIMDAPRKVNFAEYADDIDYISTWALDSGSEVEARILEHYSLIKQNGDLKIFGRTASRGNIEL